MAWSCPWLIFHVRTTIFKPQLSQFGDQLCRKNVDKNINLMTEVGFKLLCTENSTTIDGNCEVSVRSSSHLPAGVYRTSNGREPVAYNLSHARGTSRTFCWRGFSYLFNGQMLLPFSYREIAVDIPILRYFFAFWLKASLSLLSKHVCWRFALIFPAFGKQNLIYFDSLHKCSLVLIYNCIITVILFSLLQLISISELFITFKKNMI